MKAAAAPLDAAAPPFRAWLVQQQRRPRLVLGLLAIALLCGMVISIGLGAVQIPPGETMRALLAGAGLPVAANAQFSAIIGWLRLPRALMAVLAGGGLAIAGAAMQGLFRNALAEPGVAGVSSGAALGAVGAIVLGGRFGVEAGVWAQAIAAFLGAIGAMMIVQRLSRSTGYTSVARMLLAGIAITAMAEAGVGYCTTIASNAELRSVTFWNLGSFSGATWTSVAAVAACIVIPSTLLLRESRALNIMLLGEAEMRHLGGDPERTKRRIIVLSALITGGAVAMSGRLWFVGLLCPHLVRLTLGTDHRWLLPGSMLCGGLVLLLADLVCRTAAAPMEIPLGVVTALLGAPFFLWLLRREGSL